MALSEVVVEDRASGLAARSDFGGWPLYVRRGGAVDQRPGRWRTAVEVERTREIGARVVVILRHLPATYDDVVYRVHPSAMTVVTRSAAALKSGAERVMVRPYPPPTLAAVA